MTERVCVGVVVGAHGVRGAVRVKPFTGEPEAIAAYGPVEDESGRRLKVKVLGVAKGIVNATLQGVADRDAAEAMKGTKLYVPRTALPQTEEDEFYYSDLIGLAAELEDGSRFGTVRALYDFGAGDVLEVALPDGRVEMLPFTKAVVPVVDVKGRRLVLSPPATSEARPESEEA